jgi:hypothetical protein
LFVYHISGEGTYHTNEYIPTPDSITIGGFRRPEAASDVIVMTITQGDYDLALGLSTHEYGHTLHGPRGDIISDLYENGYSNGLGGFCCEAGNGFRSPDGTHTVPGFHNPLVRTGKYWVAPVVDPWISETVISTSQLDYPLLDGATEGRIYEVTPDTTRPTQYFLITNHMKISPWEVYYPNRGVMIWHVSSTTSTMVQRGGRKRLDIEDASGMWDWTFENIPDSAFDEGGGCWPEYQSWIANTGTNTGVANPVSGIDSMDVVYVSGRGEPSARTYPDNNAGNARTFFGAGSVFGPNTNPNSNLYYGSNQSIRSGFEIQIAKVDTMNHETIAHIILGGRWYGLYP